MLLYIFWVFNFFNILLKNVCFFVVYILGFDEILINIFDFLWWVGIEFMILLILFLVFLISCLVCLLWCVNFLICLNVL